MWNPETNIKGPKGDKGDTGDQGPPGADGTGGASDWGDITGKPSTFPPDPEAVDDRVAGLLVAGANITLTYNDTGNTLTIASTASGGGGASVYVGTSPPVGAPASSLWFESNTGLLYINFQDTDSLQWVIVPPSVSAASIGAVAYTPQSPTVSEQVQARKNVYAAPFDALAYNGMQINGSMEVSQQFGATSIPAAGSSVDGWTAGVSGGTVMVAQAANAAPLASGVFFNSCLGLTASVAVPSVAGTYAYFGQNIEGQRVARLGWGLAGARPVTVSFWIYASNAGTIAVAVRNLAVNRVYVIDVPVTAALWQYKTVTFPGDTTGAWPKDNTTGMTLLFTLAAGSTYQTAAGVWTAGGNFLGSPATTNLLSTNNSAVYITGVTVLPGIEAPTAAQSPLIMRPYDQELLTCRRYWWCSNPIAAKGTGVGTLAGYSFLANTIGYNTWRFTVPMRAVPAVTLWSAGVQNNVRNPTSGAAIGVGSMGASNISTEGGASFNVGSLAVSQWVDFDLQADARL